MTAGFCNCEGGLDTGPEDGKCYTQNMVHKATALGRMTDPPRLIQVLQQNNSKIDIMRTEKILTTKPKKEPV